MEERPNKRTNKNYHQCVTSLLHVRRQSLRRDALAIRDTPVSRETPQGKEDESVPLEGPDLETRRGYEDRAGGVPTDSD